MAKMSQGAVQNAAREWIGDDLPALSLAQLHRLITVSQHVTDALLNEIEARGELTFHGDMPVVPYVSDFTVETILTRPD